MSTYQLDTSTSRANPTPTPMRRLTVPKIQEKKGGEPIVMLTAYTARMAQLLDPHCDLLLVGDSLGVVMLGHETTVPVTMDDVIRLTQAVVRGAKRALVVADLPFMSYQASVEDAVRNAGRLMQEAGAQAVKLEGGVAVAESVRRIVEAGIPVMGHIGLTPQSVHAMGGFKVQGKELDAARAIVDDAVALAEAGCFAIVLEAVPAAVAARVTADLAVPTVGIGAGPGCDGQVLVWHDLLGLYDGPAPRFVKQYAALTRDIRTALEAYVADVRAGTFPEEQHTYAMPDEELALFEATLDAPVAR